MASTEGESKPRHRSVTIVGNATPRSASKRPFTSVLSRTPSFASFDTRVTHVLGVEDPWFTYLVKQRSHILPRPLHTHTLGSSHQQTDVHGVQPGDAVTLCLAGRRKRSNNQAERSATKRTSSSSSSIAGEGDEASRRSHSGDTQTFIVTRSDVYSDISALIADLGYVQVLPGSKSDAHAVGIFRSMYGNAAKDGCPVVALHLDRTAELSPAAHQSSPKQDSYRVDVDDTRPRSHSEPSASVERGVPSSPQSAAMQSRQSRVRSPVGTGVTSPRSDGGSGRNSSSGRSSRSSVDEPADQSHMLVWRASAYSTPSPAKLPQLSVAIVQADCGLSHTLILTADGAVYSQGSNSFGQLGLGTTDPSVVPDFRRVTLPEDARAIRIACGAEHSAIVDEGGRLYCFGRADFGQCGDAQLPVMCPAPHLVCFPPSAEHGGVRRVACGTTHTVVVCRDGSCWAFGSGPQLGIGSTRLHAKESKDAPTSSTAAQAFEDARSPRALLPRKVKLSAGMAVLDVSCGRDHTLFLCTAKPWSIQTQSTTPGTADASSSVAPQTNDADDQAMAGIEELIGHARRIRLDVERHSPSPMSASDKARSEHSFGSQANIASAEAETSHQAEVEAAEDPDPNQSVFHDATSAMSADTGDAASMEYFDASEEHIPGKAPLDWAHLSTLPISDWDTVVLSCGMNDQGQLGLGTSVRSIDRPTPVSMLSGKRVMRLKAGSSHSMAVTCLSHVYGWGNNSHGQLGFLNEGDCVCFEPTFVPTLADLNVCDVACGSHHSVVMAFGRSREGSRDSTAPSPTQADTHDAHFQRGEQHQAVFHLGPKQLQPTDLPFSGRKSPPASAASFKPHVVALPTGSELVRFVAAGGNQSALIAQPPRLEHLLYRSLIRTEMEFLARLRVIIRSILLPYKAKRAQAHADSELTRAFAQLVAKTCQVWRSCCNLVVHLLEYFTSSAVDADVAAVFHRVEVFETIKSFAASLCNATSVGVCGDDQLKGQVRNSFRSLAGRFQNADTFLAWALSSPIDHAQFLSDVAKQLSLCLDSEMLDELDDNVTLDRLYQSSHEPWGIARFASASDMSQDTLREDEPTSNSSSRAASQAALLRGLATQWQQLVADATQALALAEETGVFWQSHAWLAKAMMRASRRVLLDSSQCSLHLQSFVAGGTSFFLFNDCFVTSNLFSTKTHSLATTWVVDLADADGMTNAFELVFPEDRLVVYSSSEGDKSKWLDAFTLGLSNLAQFDRESGVPALSTDPEPLYVPSPSPIAELESRITSYKFKNHIHYRECTYHGNWLLGVPEGHGIMRLKSGAVYKGSFLGGVPHGLASFHGSDATSELFEQVSSKPATLSEIDVLSSIHNTPNREAPSENTLKMQWAKGEWYQGKLHGRASALYVNGDRYHGMWHEGKPHGFGVFIAPSHIYIGGWHKGLFDGFGVFVYRETGSRYVGGFQRGIYHGYGTMMWSVRRHSGGGSRYASSPTKTPRRRKSSVAMDTGIDENEQEPEAAKRFHMLSQVPIRGEAALLRGHFSYGNVVGDAHAIRPDQVVFEGIVDRTFNLLGRGHMFMPGGSRIDGKFTGCLIRPTDVKTASASFAFGGRRPSIRRGDQLGGPDVHMAVPDHAARVEAGLQAIRHCQMTEALLQRCATELSLVIDMGVDALQSQEAELSSSQQTETSQLLRLSLMMQAESEDTQSHEYLLKALRNPHHALGRLITDVTACFQAAFPSDSVTSRWLLPQAVAETQAFLNGLSHLVSKAFPGTQSRYCLDTQSSDNFNGAYGYLSDVPTPTTFDHDVLEPLVLSRLSRTLRPLYQHAYEEKFSTYWRNVGALGRLTDAQLMKLLCVSPELWQGQIRPEDTSPTSRAVSGSTSQSGELLSAPMFTFADMISDGISSASSHERVGHADTTPAGPGDADIAPTDDEIIAAMQPLLSAYLRQTTPSSSEASSRLPPALSVEASDSSAPSPESLPQTPVDSRPEPPSATTSSGTESTSTRDHHLPRFVQGVAGTIGPVMSSLTASIRSRMQHVSDAAGRKTRQEAGLEAWFDKTTTRDGEGAASNAQPGNGSHSPASSSHSSGEETDLQQGEPAQRNRPAPLDLNVPQQRASSSSTSTDRRSDRPVAPVVQPLTPAEPTAFDGSDSEDEEGSPMAGGSFATSERDARRLFKRALTTALRSVQRAHHQAGQPAWRGGGATTTAKKGAKYADAVQLLKRFCSEHGPAQKLNALHACVSTLMACARADLREGHLMNSDDLLPLLIFVAVRARQRWLGVDVALLLDFLDQELASSESMFLTTTLSAALEFLCQPAIAEADV